MNKFSPLIFAAMALVYASCHHHDNTDILPISAFPQLSVNISSLSADMDGDTLEIEIVSDSTWTIQAPSYLSFSKKAGHGNDFIHVYIDTNLQYARQIQIVVALSYDPETTDTLNIKQEGHIIEYEGESYPCKRMKDGRIWMCENLRYVPEGLDPATDPAVNAGVWYACNGLDVSIVHSDPDSVTRYGYLYDAPAAIGFTNVDTTDYVNQTFERARGISPEGWHIPSDAEIKALYDAYYNSDSKKTFYTDLNDDGFNWLPIGMRKKNSLTDNTLRYLTTGGLFSSTIASWNLVDNQPKYFFKVLTFNYRNNVLLYNNASAYAGYAIRCIKDE